VLAQIVRALGPAAASEVGGAADDDEAERLRQPHRDHVGGDELAEPDAGVKSSGRDIDEFSLAAISTSISGYAWQKDAISGSSRIGTTARGTERRNSPAGRCPSSLATPLAATSSSKAGFARERNRCPASVMPTLRVVRMKSAAPTRASSVRTAWLIADGVTRVPRPPCETAVLGNAQERSTPSSAPCLTVKFCFIGHQHYRE